MIFRVNNIKTNIHEKIKKNFYTLKEKDSIILPKDFHNLLHKNFVNFLKNKTEINKSFENLDLYKFNENFNPK